MVRPFRTLLASLKQLRGTRQRPREVQELADLHRLYLFTRLREEQYEEKQQPAAAVADRIVAEASALSDDERRQRVARALRAQASAMARAVHEALERDAGEVPAAAAALRKWALEDQGRRRRRPMARPGRDDDDSDDDDDEDGNGEAAAPSTTPSRRKTSPADLALLAARRVGFGLRVGPSAVGRGAGLGLFVEGAAAAASSPSATAAATAPRAAVPAGATLALFPGLCYTRDDYRRMAGYPKVDRGNPYLAARYDGLVVDSQPWARGDGVAAAVEEPEAKDGSSSSPSPSYRDQADPFRPPRRPVPRSFLARMAKASDGPRLPPQVQAALRAAADARAAGLRWASATTDEAPALELILPLEGRNPYALAHFANHPAPGQPPNAMLAPVDFEGGAFGGERGSGDDNDSLPAELRAYLPFAPYEAAAAMTVWPVERALKMRGEEAAMEVAARGSSSPLNAAACRELALRPARGLALVSLRPLADGEEIVFDYRLSPGMLGRPSWYVPCDEEAEDRRWA